MSARYIILAVLAGSGLWGGAAAQVDYGGRLGDRVGDRVIYHVPGVTTYMEALDPTVQRWYIPAPLFGEFGRNQWEYTNYARQAHRRYINPASEGDLFYDPFGRLITRGWLVYDWRQTKPLIAESSSIRKGGQYNNWFSRLVISGDSKGQYRYSVMIGDEIWTTLTPMTFRKAGFNGVVADFAADRFRATGLFSRISFPLLSGGTARFQYATNLTAGRVEADLTDSFTLGMNFVNSHNNTGSNESFQGNVFKGALTAGQLAQRVDLLLVRLSDDSPEDGEGGAVLVSEEIEIRTTLSRQEMIQDQLVHVERDTVILSSSIGFRPTIAGGKIDRGFLTADGADQIILQYHLAPKETTGEEGTLRALFQQHLDLTLSEAEAAISAIRDVRFRLVLANDYRVGVSSNRQTDKFNVPQFLPVARADGNIKNQLNQREVVFDYGLPTANQIIGLTAEVRDFLGFDFYGEINLNTQYRKYPSIGRDSHRAISGIEGDPYEVGWLVNLAFREGPWSFKGEGFGMEDGYRTSVLTVNRDGVSDYAPEAVNLHYEFVDDNDDNDRQPDWLRVGEGSFVPTERRSEIEARGVSDPAVFPGYDENRDFISDFNQNSTVDRVNFFPDYDEPFLRYAADRPEFLFGIDLNNNGWAERFENDQEPDYPYKRDHWGYNVFGGLEVAPGIQLRVGQLRQTRLASDRRNLTSYGMFILEQSGSRWGRLRIFDMVKKAEDAIADHLVQWIIPRSTFGAASESAGSNVPVLDPLAAEDTWINTFYADWEYSSPRLWRTLHRFKWETWRQRDSGVEFLRDASDEADDSVVAFDPLGPEGRNGRRTSGFVGLINKIEYVFSWRSLSLRPKFKSEFLREVPFSRAFDERRSWDALFFFVGSIPVLETTEFEFGLEQRSFFDLEGEDELEEGLFTGDFRGSVLALQLTNISQYLGYELTTQVGIRLDRRSIEVVDRSREIETSGLSFLSIIAGLK